MYVPGILKMMVGMGFCQLVQDPVIFNGAGRDAFVARLIDHTLVAKKGAKNKKASRI